jgi:hypothetical protein
MINTVRSNIYKRPSVFITKEIEMKYANRWKKTKRLRTMILATALVPFLVVNVNFMIHRALGEYESIAAKSPLSPEALHGIELISLIGVLLLVASSFFIPLFAIKNGE